MACLTSCPWSVILRRYLRDIKFGDAHLNAELRKHLNAVLTEEMETSVL